MKSQAQKILDAARRGKVSGRRALKKRQTKRRAGKLRHGANHASDPTVVGAVLSGLGWEDPSVAIVSESEQECQALLMPQSVFDEANEAGMPGDAGDIERGDEADFLLAPERQRNPGSSIDAVSETPAAGS
jgi:hypothetical protein